MARPTVHTISSSEDDDDDEVHVVGGSSAKGRAVHRNASSQRSTPAGARAGDTSTGRPGGGAGGSGTVRKAAATAGTSSQSAALRNASNGKPTPARSALAWQADAASPARLVAPLHAAPTLPSFLKPNTQDASMSFSRSASSSSSSGLELVPDGTSLARRVDLPKSRGSKTVEIAIVSDSSFNSIVSKTSTPPTSYSDAGDGKRVATLERSAARLKTFTSASKLSLPAENAKGKQREASELDSDDEYIGGSNKTARVLQKRAGSLNTVPPSSSRKAHPPNSSRQSPILAEPLTLVAATEKLSTLSVKTKHKRSAGTAADTDSASSRPNTRSPSAKLPPLQLEDRKPPVPPPLPKNHVIPLPLLLVPPVRFHKMTRDDEQCLKRDIEAVLDPRGFFSGKDEQGSLSTLLGSLSAPTARSRLTEVPVPRTPGGKSRKGKEKGNEEGDSDYSVSEGEGSDDDDDGEEVVHSELDESESETTLDPVLLAFKQQTRSCRSLPADSVITLVRKRRLPCLEEALADPYGGPLSGTLASDQLGHQFEGGGKVGKRKYQRTIGADVLAMEHGLLHKVADEFALEPPHRKKRKGK